MRLFVLFSALLALGIAPTAEAAPKAAHPSDKLDHVLLWGRDIDQVTAIMTVKLGFQVRPGRNPGGVANRYIRIEDGGFIELLGITRPNPDMDPGMQADQAALRGGAGARAFGFHSRALDLVHTQLHDKGFAVTPLFTASPNDPDGSGPKAPPRWRLFAFEKAPLSSSTFFIDYAVDKTGPADPVDDRTARQHPNGTRTLSEFWLLSANAAADRKSLEDMGLDGAVAVRLPQIAARGFCVPIGPTGLLVLEPDGSGIAADALSHGGPQVLGVSMGVADLDQTQKRVERGYEQKLKRYKGIAGDAILAPTGDDLGMLIEFHAISKTAKPCG